MAKIFNEARTFLSVFPPKASGLESPFSVRLHLKMFHHPMIQATLWKNLMALVALKSFFFD
ncbi:MAG TPA: hypothetical protein EYG38_21960 [Verrucomicrobia bacterium]|nr:hypothetical protein [Verrucomicrobiota bacterium]